MKKTAARFQVGDYIRQKQRESYDDTYAVVVGFLKNGGERVVSIQESRPIAVVDSVTHWFPAPMKISPNDVPPKLKVKIDKKAAPYMSQPETSMNLSARLMAIAKEMVADDVGALVAPFESVLKSLGFRPSVHNARTSKDFVFWILDLDPAKYELARMVVTFVPDKVEIVAGNLREDGGGEVEFDFSHPMRGYSPSALRRDIRSNLWTMGKISESKAASELLRIAKSIIGGDVNTLNGISNQAAKRYVNRILSEHTKGFFHDQSWEGVSRVWKALDDNGIDWTMTGNEYQKDSPSGMPTRKQWKFEVNFVNNKDRPVTLYGVLIASGAGSVDDVLSKYDLVSYVS